MRIQVHGGFAILLLLIGFAPRGFPDQPVPAERPGTAEKIAQLIEQLNADRFRTRHQAYGQLLKAGKKCCPSYVWRPTRCRPSSVIASVN